jgi:hypothetical protein
MAFARDLQIKNTQYSKQRNARMNEYKRKNVGTDVFDLNSVVCTNGRKVVCYFTVAMSCCFAAFLISNLTLASSLSIPSKRKIRRVKHNT